ncbi:MAG: hypothetical protein NC114_10575 [Ruminococcus flavefaciens]|nr:hypothetical protein [Ruminococcus flavefaciens]
MTEDEAKGLAKEFLLQFATPDRPNVSVTRIIHSCPLGFTVEAGFYGEDGTNVDSLIWLEVDAKTRRVEFCLIG